jgi:hypothetical protein
MDEKKLRNRLSPRTKLILGLVEETVPQFIQGSVEPVGFVAFDVDIYSSTKAAFRVFDASYENLLPRVHCYFDEVTGYTYNEWEGELLAIKEFNQEHDDRKLGPVVGHSAFAPRRYRNKMCWNGRSYVAFFFHHPRYNDWDGSIPRAVTLGLR